MKYFYMNPLILLPWFDTDGNKQWSTLKFIGWVERRKLRRCIRKFINNTFNKTVSKTYLDEIITASLASGSTAQYTRKRATDAEVEAWLERIQCDDDTPDSEGDAYIQNEPAGEARLEVSAMPDQSQV